MKKANIVCSLFCTHVSCICFMAPCCARSCEVFLATSTSHIGTSRVRSKMRFRSCSCGPDMKNRISPPTSSHLSAVTATPYDVLQYLGSFSVRFTHKHIQNLLRSTFRHSILCRHLRNRNQRIIPRPRSIHDLGGITITTSDSALCSTEPFETPFQGTSISTRGPRETKSAISSSI